MNIFWTEKNIFGEADCRWWSRMGSTPRGSEVGNCSEHFLDRGKYFWRVGLPLVIEHGFRPPGVGAWEL